MFAYQKTGGYFARVAEGLEETAAAELSRLGAEEVRTDYRGVSFRAEPEPLYRIHFHGRIPSRLLAPLVSFECHSDKYLYKTGLSIDWPGLFSVRETFAVEASVANSRITHSRFAAQRLKDAVADRFREEEGGERPSVDRRDPDVRLHLRIHGNKAVISLDTSGGALHRRGYRRVTGEAPMQETLAAAIVDFAEYDGGRPLLDPMCGTGTLLAEALIRAGKIPAGLLRTRFGLRHLPDFDGDLWNRIRRVGEEGIDPPARGVIRGSDIDGGAVTATRTNLRVLPGGGDVIVEKADFRDLTGFEEGVILCNPPYGIRSGGGEDPGRLISDLGDFLKRRCRGSAAYVYLGDRELVKRIGLRPAWKKPLKNGGLDGRLLKLELY